jgi:hypothetical protein
MKRLEPILLLACALCAGAYARAQAQTHTETQAAQLLMQQMAGVYKRRFMNGTIAPGKHPREADIPYQSEDVVEIVPFDADHVYVRADLDFYNGHVCKIAGMGRYEHGAFVYHDPDRSMPDEPPCTLKVGVDKDKLYITDRATPDSVESCSRYCGARGNLNYEIGMDKRRPIRYLPRLKASPEYAKAIDDLRQTEPQAPH